MMRSFARAAVAGIVATTLVVGPAGHVNALGPDPDEQTAGLAAGLTTLAGYFGGFATAEELGLPIPGTALVPGSSDGIDVTTLFAGLAAAVAASDGEEVGELAEDIAAYDVAGSGATRAVQTSATAVAPATGSAVHGLDITVDASRTVPAPLRLSKPAAGGDPAVELAPTGTGSGLPLELAWTSQFGVRYDTDTDEFWLVVDRAASSPRFSLTSAVDGDPADDATEPDAPAFSAGTADVRLGIGTVSIQPGSTVELAQTLQIAFADEGSYTGGDGRLAFMEKANDGTMVPAELLLPRDQNTRIDPSGSLQASLSLASALVPSTVTAPDARVTVAPTDLASPPSQLPITTSSGYADLAVLDNITATDLLGTLGQLVATLRSAQSHPKADRSLPFLDAQISDAAFVGTELAEFVLDQTLPDDPATPQNEFGQAKFETFEEMVSELKASTKVPSLVDAELVPEFLPAAGGADPELRYRLHLTRALDTTDQAFTTSVLLGADGQPVPKGSPSLGSQLRTDTTTTPPSALTGVAGLTSTASPAATKRTAYELDVVTGVNLRDAVSCVGESTCDDPDTPVVETDDLPVYERAFLQVDPGTTADALEMTVTTLASTAVTQTKGRVGFAEVETLTGSSISVVRQDDTKPTLTVDLDLGSTNRKPLTEILELLGDESTSALTAVQNLGADATLKLQAYGDGTPRHAYLPDVATITVDWTDATQPLKTSHVSLDANAVLLRTLDFNVGSADALAGRFLNTLDSVASTLKGLAGLAGDDVANKPLPLVGTSPSKLFSQWDVLRAKVEELRTAQPPSLRELEEQLQTKLGMSADDLELDLRYFPAPGTGTDVPNLVVRLDHDRELDEKLPLAFQVDGLGGLVGLGADGSVDVEGTSKVDLGVPIPLTTDEPTKLYVLDTSLLHVDARIEGGPGLELAAAIGGLQASLGDKDVGPAGQGEIKANAAYDLRDPDANASAPKRVELPTFVQNLTGTMSSTDVTCAPPDPDGPTQEDGSGSRPATAAITGEVACLSMPVFVNGNPIVPEPEDATHSNYLKVTVADDLTVDATPPTGLDAAYFAAIALDFGPIREGLKALGQLAGQALRAASFNGKLPLIGEDLAAAADVAADLDTVAVLNWTRKVSDADTGDPNVAPTVADVREDVLGPIADQIVATGLVVDTAPLFNGADTAGNREDVKFTLYCGGTTECTDGDSPTNISDITVQTTLGRGAISADPAAPGGTCTSSQCKGSLDVDLGIPAVNLRVEGDVSTQTGWQATLGFGVSRTEGFYLLENPLPPSGVADSTDSAAELSLGVSASLSDTFSATARLGFLDVTATESGVRGSDTTPVTGFKADDDVAAHQSTVGLNVGLNLRRPGGTGADERIYNGELLGLVTRIPEAWALTLKGGADIDLHLAVSADQASLKGLPRIESDFLLDWTFDLDTANGQGFQTAVPQIRFNNVGLDPGSVLTGTLKEIITDVRRYTKPVDPVREFLFSPVPVISDLAVEFGQDPITYFDIVEAAGSGDYQLLRDINTLLDLVAQFADPLAAGDKPVILIGHFTVLGAKADGPPAGPGQATSLIGSQEQSADAQQSEAGSSDTRALPGVLDDVLDEAKTKIKETLKSKQDEAGIDPEPDFAFPILEEPGCVFTLMLGSDCEIVRWRPDGLVARFDYSQKFGPFFGVLYVTLAGSASAKATIGVGYDTKGLRQVVAGSSALDLLDGLFVEDLRHGVDIAEVELKGSIIAGGEIGVGIAGAGVRGGITATVDLNLRDGPELDGKLRIDEVGAKLRDNFLCLFDISGALEAFLEVYAYFGVCPLCEEESYTLATVRLLDFAELNSTSCAPKDPVLATENTTTAGTAETGTLRLNIGPWASARGPGWDHTAEQYTVNQHPNGKLTVTAFGYTQVYSGTKVVFDAGGDSDSVSFAGSTANPVPASGPTAGETYDKPKDGASPAFTLPVVGNAGDGVDNITTGDGADDITGGEGVDRINLGGGDDRADGGTGADVISGGAGNDPRLVGGGDDDVIDGGLGADGLDGGDGNDRLFGGRDANTKTGVVLDGNDVLLGGPDGDGIDAGSGADVVYGDSGTYTGDIMSVNSSGATVDNVDESARGDGEGTGDSDAVADDDELHGGPGNDTVWAGPGQDGADTPDTYCGDTVDGGDGNDQLHGQGGPDCLVGGAGNDSLYGGPARDRAAGDDGDDDVFGQEDGDSLTGGPGRDLIDGGAGGDAIDGGPANDALVGGPGGDGIGGGSGDDLVAGDTASTTRTAGVLALGTIDDDASASDDGNDRVYGEDGSDVVHGQGGVDTLRGGTGTDDIRGGAGGDHVFGDDGDDVLRGNGDIDDVHGGPGADLASGDGGADDVFGDTGDDRLTGGAHTTTAQADAGDDIYGGNGNDVAVGDNGTIGTDSERTVTLADPAAATSTYGGDVIDGGDGNDVGHGQGGVDTLYGGTGDDRLLGELDGDEVHGQSGHDHLLGDRGTITRPASGSTTWPGGAPRYEVALAAPDSGGVDTITGGEGNDRGYGGAAGDTITGDVGDDYLEGNGGQDSIYGLDAAVDLTDSALAAMLGDQDDILGGSSPAHPGAGTATAAATPGASDVGELTLEGGPDADVLTGDNAIVERVVEGAAYKADPNGFGTLRVVTLLDTEKSGDGLAAVSGGDLVSGGTGTDRAFGQGGPDTVKGNEADDVVIGNQGGDLLEGNDGEDDVVGGSELAGQPDGGDALHGGAGADVAIGDNGVILRGAPRADDPQTDRTTASLGVATTRRIAFFDVATADSADDTGTSGSDVVSGGADADALFGQDSRDYLLGGSADDTLEGMGGDDFVFGDRIPVDVEGDAAPQELKDAGGLPAAPSGTPGARSDEPVLSGPQGSDGEDDMLGGTAVAGALDGDDVLYGGGAADSQLGDNGRITRTRELDPDAYDRVTEFDGAVRRQVERYDVGAGDDTSGRDTMRGEEGNDRMWGQDGNDIQYGGAGHDDMLGELGDDTMRGEAGQDAMVGDRGSITDRVLPGSPTDCAVESSIKGPTFLSYRGMCGGTFDRRVSLTKDTQLPGNPSLTAPGTTDGGNDWMRGGDDHDAMHGGAGDDLMNGDTHGDWLLGGNGTDAMWGGKGSDDPADPNKRGDNDAFVDILLGGQSGTTADTADVLDYRPRPGDDPRWFEITDTADDTADPMTVLNNQHNNGIDLIFGGSGRDVLQGNVGVNGPDFGDRLIDWTGAFNLYTRCNASYGDDGDVRQASPGMESFLESVAYGIGAGESLRDVRTAGTSGAVELALVKPGDPLTSGSAFPSTPGNFESASCIP